MINNVENLSCVYCYLDCITSVCSNILPSFKLVCLSLSYWCVLVLCQIYVVESSFSQSMPCIFILLMVSFDDILNSYAVQFTYLLWLAILLSHLRNICTSPSYENILLCFLLEVLLFYLLPLGLCYIFNYFLCMMYGRCQGLCFSCMNSQLT